MNQRQKRQKRAVVRQEQKLARLAERDESTECDRSLSLHEKIIFTKKVISKKEGYVTKDAKEIANFKFFLQILSVLYFMHVLTSVCLWKQGDDIFIILLTSCVMIFSIAIYFSYKNGIQHRVVELEEAKKFLKELELQLIAK